MLAMHAHAGSGGGAHVIRLAIVGVGILGLVALRDGWLLRAPALTSARFWHRALPTYVAASALLLVALSQSGAGA